MTRTSRSGAYGPGVWALYADRLVRDVEGGRSWWGLRKIHRALHMLISILIQNCRRVACGAHAWEKCVRDEYDSAHQNRPVKCWNAFRFTYVVPRRNHDFSNLLLPFYSGPHLLAHPRYRHLARRCGLETIQPLMCF